MLDIYAGLSGGGAVFRALVEQSGADLTNPPSSTILQGWGQKLNMNDGDDTVNEINAYSDLLADVWTIYGGFTNPTYKITTQVLNEL